MKDIRINVRKMQIDKWVEVKSTLTGKTFHDKVINVDGRIKTKMCSYGYYTFDGNFEYDVMPPCQCEYYTLTRILKPSEVVVEIGNGLKGTVSGTVIKFHTKIKLGAQWFALKSKTTDYECYLPDFDESFQKLICDQIGRAHV